MTSFTQDPANVDMRSFPSITRFLRSRVNEAGNTGVLTTLFRLLTSCLLLVVLVVGDPPEGPVTCIL
mgnify:FL=1